MKKNCGIKQPTWGQDIQRAYQTLIGDAKKSRPPMLPYGESNDGKCSAYSYTSDGSNDLRAQNDLSQRIRQIKDLMTQSQNKQHKLKKPKSKGWSLWPSLFLV